MNENEQDVEKTTRNKAIVFVAAVLLTTATKLLLPDVSGTQFTPEWATLAGDLVSSVIIAAGYFLAVEYLLRRGGYSV